MIVVPAAIGGAFVTGVFAGFCVLCSALYAYERWMYHGIKSALQWARA